MDNINGSPSNFSEIQENAPSITTLQVDESTTQSTNSTSPPLTATGLAHFATVHDIAFKLGLSFVVFGAICVCALAFILAFWYTRQKVRQSLNRHRSGDNNYSYDNQVDILNTEMTSDTVALERAFGTGVLVIQDSPIIRQRDRLTGTGTGPTGRVSGYMSTAESDTEHNIA